MEPHNISKEISEVAQNYLFAKQPAFVRDFMEWLAKIVRALSEFLRDLFRHDGGALNSVGMSTMLQIAIWLIGIGGLALLIWNLAYRAKQLNRAAKAQVRGADEVEELRDAAGWKRQAESLAAQGNFKGACRALYLSLLQCLHERGIAEFAPARTNYEYSYFLSRYPEVQQRFRRVAEKVELIWFGDRLASDSDYDEALKELLEVDAQLVGIQQRQVGDRIALK